MKRIQLLRLFVLATCFSLVMTMPALAAEQLPLDSEQNFMTFFKKFTKLPKAEQLRYCALPFISEELVNNDSNDPNGYSYKIVTKTVDTFASLQQFTHTWKSLALPADQLRKYQYEYSQPKARDGFVEINMGRKESSVLNAYEFKQMGISWRMVKIYLNNSGL